VLRLARFFGNSPAFWLNLQLRWDLYHAREAEAADLIGQHFDPSFEERLHVESPAEAGQFAKTCQTAFVDRPLDGLKSL